PAIARAANRVRLSSGACSYLARELGDEPRLFLHELRELARRHADALESLQVELARHLRIGQRLQHFAMDALRDLGWRAGGQPQAKPVDELVALEACFLHRRHLRQTFPALGPREREHARL